MKIEILNKDIIVQEFNEVLEEEAGKRVKYILIEIESAMQNKKLEILLSEFEGKFLNALTLNNNNEEALPEMKQRTE